MISGDQRGERTQTPPTIHPYSHPARAGLRRRCGWLSLILTLLAGQLLVLLGAATDAAAAPGDRPVSIVIDSISPQVALPNTPIVVAGSLVNTSSTAITELTMRLQRGPALETRSELADNDADPMEVNDSSTAFVDLDQSLDGSGELRFSYSTTPEELGLFDTGAYPLLVNLNGRGPSEPPSRVGEQVILLPYLAQSPTAVTQLSWLWPLVSTPERTAAGVFTGDRLSTSVGPGGRLDRALAALEGTQSPDGSVSPPRPVTLVVDPELLDAVRVLAAGEYPLLVAGQQQASSDGSAEAASWLARLRALASTLPVVSLPYADPDIGTLIAQGQGAAVERRLPDAAAGDLVREVLGVAPVSSIAWPPDGSGTDPAVLDLLADHDVAQVIVDEELAFADGDDEVTLNAVSTIDAPSGPMTALVGDHALRELLQADADEPGSRSVVEQRFLAEMVVIAAEAPTRSRHLLIAPRRDFNPETAGRLLAAAAGQPWLGTEQPTDLTGNVATAAARSLLPATPGVSAIPDAQLAILVAAMRARDDFASALAEPADNLVAIDRALARAATSNRDPNPESGLAAVRDVAAAVEGLRATVGIIPPANGTYSLASEDAPLVLTVFNNNAFPVEVTVALAPRGAPGVTTTNVVRELPAQTRTTIAVPADVQRSGSFTVIATVTTPIGSPLGVPVQLRVQSTVYGPVALAITIGAAALLVLLFARRSLRYWRRRRDAARSADGGSDEMGPARWAALNGGPAAAIEPDLVEPPPRSPV